MRIEYTRLASFPVSLYVFVKLRCLSMIVPISWGQVIKLRILFPCLLRCLGEKYAEGVILDLERMWDESDCRQPLVGLLSMGSDPTPSIEKLAKKLRVGEYGLRHAVCW